MNGILTNISKNWKLDARFEDNNKYFYNYDEVNSIINSEKCYVIGRKGSGKTAICEYIINSQKFNSFSVKLSFKNFPFNELYSLNNSRYTYPNQYITLWKYLIYSNVCKMMVRNENVPSNVRDELSKLYPPQDIKQLARKISEWTSTEFGATILGNGGTLKLDRNIKENEIPWIERTNTLEDVILTYCDTSKYYVVFDELDEDYRNVKVREESDLYISLLTSLFKAVQDVKSTFYNTHHQIMPIVFLRDDIYALIDDSDKNKWSDLKVELEWDKNKIKNLLAFRISKDINATFSKEMTFEEAWYKIFQYGGVTYGDHQRKKMSSFDYIARSTQLRPRDFIKYIQQCCEITESEGLKFIPPRIIKHVDRAFSNYLKNEIRDEIFPLLPDIECIFQIISNMRKWIFNVNEFISEYNKYVVAGTIKEKNVELVLDYLYNFSVIGNQHRTIKDKHFFKYLHTNMTYNKDENIVIHRGLFKSLQIE